MTLLLASVTGSEEALTALAGGADVIDLKDAPKGALVGLPPEEVRAAVQAVAGRRPVSAVAGDAATGPEDIAAAVAAIAATGVDYVKAGLYAGARDCVRALAAQARRTRLVGVMFADMPMDDGLLPLMAECGFVGAMLDTARKGGGGLLDHMEASALNEFVARCRAHSLMAGLAGSLEPPDIPRLLQLGPTFLGFRGALCAAPGRDGPLDPGALGLIRDLIPGERREELPHVVPARILARGYAKEEIATDRIFVRDFVLPVRIGAYNRERREPQDVRFNVDVEVARSGRTPDLRDVFSYDVILDGIRIICAKEHIPLVEILAERVAALVLVHPRVVSATIRVEKLEVGPGAVGVEIRRERKADVAQVHQLFAIAPAAE